MLRAPRPRMARELRTAYARRSAPNIGAARTNAGRAKCPTSWHVSARRRAHGKASKKGVRMGLALVKICGDVSQGGHMAPGESRGGARTLRTRHTHAHPLLMHPLALLAPRPALSPARSQRAHDALQASATCLLRAISLDEGLSSPFIATVRPSCASIISSSTALARVHPFSTRPQSKAHPSFRYILRHNTFRHPHSSSLPSPPGASTLHTLQSPPTSHNVTDPFRTTPIHFVVLSRAKPMDYSPFIR